ncbi:MAG TPA: hypothetical protein VGM88_34330 [Kofleriaceae bacterium]
MSEAPDAPNPQCSDGIDNDGDGLIDYPADPGCSNPEDMTEDSFAPPACSDGRDNDGDGKTDYPNDPGCLTPQQDSEDDDCPDGPNCPQCGNGIDDDGNGEIDYPADSTGCTAASDDDEFTLNTAACGATASIQQLPPSMIVSASLTAASGTLVGITDNCGESAGQTYAVALFELVLPEAKVVTASTLGSSADTILDLRTVGCVTADAVLACDDDLTQSNKSSSVTTALPAGHYIIAVVGKTTGNYKLKVELFNGTGATCFQPSDCGPGLVCRVALGDTAMTCQPHVCEDGVDDDGDGKNDYPEDPGCVSPNDDDETDDCPSGPNCPECANGIDDDGDGETDYPSDPSCTAASSVSESCNVVDGVLPILESSTAGDTSTASDDYTPHCMGTGAPDLVYSLQLPAMKTLQLQAIGNFDPGIVLLDATCGTDSQELACAEFEDPIDLTNLPAGQYFVDVDGFSGAEDGPFTLTTTGTIAVGGSCEGPLFTNGVFTCTGSSTCQGTAGSRTCFSECSDGIDNNGDGRIDYPNDPGCASADYGTENTVCPGPTCPQCADGIDNDGDGLVDYPADPSCVAASGVSESCVSADGVSQISAASTSGTTIGATDDFTPSCGFGTGSPDVMYRIDVPHMKALNITVDPGFAWEPAVTILDATCGADGLATAACEENFGVVTFGLSDLAAGSYFVDVDGTDSFESGAFTLSVGGTVAAGASCEGALFQSGVFTCESGLSCTGTPGSRICFSACSDGVDNDGDGKIDYPNDPGCASPGDNDETDTCPAGPSCPQCGDGIDNDGDGLIDYPNDPSCLAASGTSESFCTTDPDYGGAMDSTVTSGNNTTGNQTFLPSCQTNANGNDETFSLVIPVNLQSLHLDTIGSTESDTVLTVHDSTCTTELACDDDSGGGFKSLINMSSVSAGTYAVSNAAYQISEEAPFIINMSGVAVAGAACTDILFTAGVLTCPAGQTCGGGVCH